MRRALSITLLAVVAAIAATPVTAQQVSVRSNDDGQSLGLRYLTWPGRTTSARTPPERPAATPVRRNAPTASAPAPSRRATSAVIPHGGVSAPEATGASADPGRGLTPANAWMPPAAIAPVPVTPVRPQPVPPVATPQTSPASDPMAPRRDALIFRMQGATDTPPAATSQAQPQPAPATTPTRVSMESPAAGPAEQGARYYSVHRQNNRQPDPTPLPPATYVDAIAIDLPASLASQDLAAPPEPPALMRNAQGRLKAVPDTSTPDQL